VAGNYTLTADRIESLSGIAGQAALSGLHISANTKPVAIQAQGGELQLHSQQSMTIGSESGQVNIASPKRIKLQTSAGASLTIDESGIKLVCPGEIKIKAVKKSLVGGANITPTLPSLGGSEIKSYLTYVAKDTFGEPIANTEYLLFMDDGTVKKGKTDAQGRTEQIVTDTPEEVGIHIIGDEHEGFTLSFGDDE
ncbi:DUF2345 domain-containing protein, partial [Psychrobacter sp. L7]|uniref:DUF2345 domain-containing protein n=1 Tax=Psychrobacter sp. L7 TaxID=1982756 RepID=UPI001562A2FA